MEEHTKGPWEVNATKVSCMVVRDSQSIATVNHFNVDYVGNARLIAAAPTMYAALKGPHGDRLSLLQSILNTAANELDAETGADGDQDAWAMAIAESVAFIVEARAAIAKAEGGAK